MKHLLQSLAAVAALLAAPVALGQGFAEVAGEYAVPAKAAREPQLRLGVQPPAVARIRLAPVAESRLQALREANQRPEVTRKRFLIGVTRDVPAETVAATAATPAGWIPVEGGHALRLELTSPEAASMRMALDLREVPLEVEMVFFGSDLPSRLEGPVRVGDIADRTRAWWGPLTEGETQVVELFAPTGTPRVAPGIEGASHVLTTPSSRFTKRTSDIGLAGTCNVDIACNATLNAQGAFREIANSVAQMVFNDGGFTGLCTGTLLNDVDHSTQVPYLYSANHCFDESSAPFKSPQQMQSVANTLATLWFFEAAACRGTHPVSHWVQQSSGATFLYNNVTADVLFLRLNAAPPAGAFFAGWNNQPLTVGTPLVTIHHPRGDLKKVTQGSMIRFGTPGVGGGNASYIEAQWSSGTTEPGSSGAGVWSNASGAYLFRGGLYGGTALCTNPTGTDYYSRFDQVYAALATYLSAPASPTPIADFSDLWWNPNESGWGISLVQHSNRRLFVVWYTYDDQGKNTWFVMSSGRWNDSRTYTGEIYSTLGPSASATFDASRVGTTLVGTGTFTFSDANNGTFAFTINGRSGTKAITRQPY